MAVCPYPSPPVPANLSPLGGEMNQTLIGDLPIDGSGRSEHKAARSASRRYPPNHPLCQVLPFFSAASRAASQASIWVDSQATEFGPNFTGRGRWPSWTHRQSVVR
jgi:hypothetical protein